MKFYDLAVRLSEGEASLAKDIFSGTLKKMVLPYAFPFADVREFLLVATGPNPGLAVATVANVSHASLDDILADLGGDAALRRYEDLLLEELHTDSDVERIFTIVEIVNVEVVPTDHASELARRYFAGDLVEEGDTENSLADIRGKLTGP